MKSPNYALTQPFRGTFDQALETIKSTLAAQGFGILTEINVTQTMKKKLNLDYPRYHILGACNPPNAHRALQAETEIGLLLPCNVIVFEKNHQVYLSVIKPTIALTLSSNPALQTIAQIIENKLTTALKQAVNQV